MASNYEEYIRRWLNVYDQESIRNLEEARRSGQLGEQQRLWQEEQDKLYEQKTVVKNETV